MNKMKKANSELKVFYDEDNWIGRLFKRRFGEIPVEKPVPIVEGSMSSFMSPSGIGHNSRFFLIEKEMAIKICWGDFGRENISSPIVFETMALGKFAVFDEIFITDESFAPSDEMKKYQILKYDFAAFKKKYSLSASLKKLREELEVYEKGFIIKKSLYKIKDGKLYFKKSMAGGQFIEY